jgi:hypothetical protein
MPPPRFLRINGLTRADRHRTIAALRDALTGSGGWVTDFKFFSNQSVCINFEIPPKNVAALDLRLDDASLTALAAFDTPHAPREDAPEVAGTIQVSFIHHRPDLRVEVPPVPG